MRRFGDAWIDPALIAAAVPTDQGDLLIVLTNGQAFNLKRGSNERSAMAKYLDLNHPY